MKVNGGGGRQYHRNATKFPDCVILEEGPAAAFQTWEQLIFKLLAEKKSMSEPAVKRP